MPSVKKKDLLYLEFSNNEGSFILYGEDGVKQKHLVRYNYAL